MMTELPKRGPDLSVPTETYPDHMVLRPPNKLKERATRPAALRDTADIEAIIRAENALELLSPEFSAWMESELNALEQARETVAATGAEGAIGTLYRAAHDIRGQAATFGFPLAGEIADGLCNLLDQAGAKRLSQSVIDRHVEAIRAIVRENVRDRDHPLGVAINEMLAKLRSQIPDRAP